jgi:NADH:ubiquinone oxidoreductase subunit F (NADH-binding)
MTLAATRPVRPLSSRATRLTLGWHGADRPASLGEHLDRYGPPPRAARRPGALINQVSQAGLTGRGGAGFPTGMKMQAVARGRRQAVVVANAMESEPASSKDKALLGRAPHLVLDGAVLAATAVGADVVHLCLPGSRRRLAGVMRDAITEREQAGVDPVPVVLHELPDGYVSSEESSIVHWLNGGGAVPTAVPPRPSDAGVGQRPTLVDNVETLSHVALIARFGAGWFREAGLPDAPGTMLCTVSGAVSAPGVYEIEVGLPVGEVLAQAGADPGMHVLIGGYFGTWHHGHEIASLPLTAGALRRVGAAPGAGVVFALPPDACGVRETARALAWLAGQGAGQCGPCMFGLPAIADDFAHLAAGRPQGATFDRLSRRLSVIEGRGGCKHPDGAVRLARSALTAFAADLRSHVSRRTCLADGPAGPRRPVLPL